MRFDRTLKGLLHRLPVQLFELLTGSTLSELLPVEFPAVRMLIPDFVGRLADGRIVHLELTTKNESGLVWRVHDYYSLLRAAFPGAKILQIILYMGAAPLTIRGELEDGPLRFSCRVVDFRELDGERLLASASLDDNILAVLCCLPDAPNALRQIVERMAVLGPKERADLAQELLILCGLRGLEETARKELETMPIEIDLMENKVFREIFEEMARKRVEVAVREAVSKATADAAQQGQQAGEERILRHQILSRFGPLPGWAEERLSSARQDLLETWAIQLLDASTLEGVFAPPSH